MGPSRPSGRVILLLAMTDRNEAFARCRALGGAAHLPKPPKESALRKAAFATLQSAELKSKLDSQSALASPTTPEEFAAFIKAEQAKWGPLVAATGVKLE